MFVNNNEDFELKNPDDPLTMKIGMNINSETLIPKPA